MPITVFVADHTDIARRAICRLVDDSCDDVQLVGEATSFAETIRMATELQPQVLVIDVHMPDKDNVAPEDFKALLTLVKSRLVVVSIWGDRKTKDLATSFGAETLLDKIDLPETLIPAILRIGLQTDAGAND
jgi:two-component system, NarL family, nitrate/nitrite response regulator NarL